MEFVYKTTGISGLDVELPSIVSISKNSDNIAGGTSLVLTINYKNLSGHTVAIGGSSATVTDETVNGDNLEVTCTTPALSLGLKDIVITDSDGDSDTWGNAFKYISSSVPAIPTGLTVTVQVQNTLLITWNFNPDTLTFDVYRSLSAAAGYSLIDNIADITLTDTSLTADTTYFYKIIAKNTTGDSIFSDIASGKVPVIEATIRLSSPQLPDLNRNEALFFNDRLWQFVKSVAALKIKHVVRQQVYYYELSEDTLSSSHKLYGLRKKKIWKHPKMLYGRILRKPVLTLRSEYGNVSVHKILIYFDINHLLLKDVNINKMTGNQILWDHKPFSVKKVQMFDSTHGHTEFKMTVIVTAIYTQD